MDDLVAASGKPPVDFLYERIDFEDGPAVGVIIDGQLVAIFSSVEQMERVLRADF